MKYRQGYKVLAVRYGLLQSTSSPVPVIYEEGKHIKPKRRSGPLAVFNTKESAEDFILHDLGSLLSDFRVFKCDYLRSRKMPPKWVQSWGNDHGLWITGRLKLTLQRHELPLGTDLASVVILKEEV